ncbi:hypothetical protein [Neoroseomonas soli]|uniref:Uncharacterized protein n=1 Tax=Neoroseomonas soli TaxID=1081025 RepID=A0A9X9WXQ3_9PROT|nr:hypothetical protein [Neoroseomonas soli]MBR0671932.1 hypothetical protein [Neoroseomonas soli]
MEGINSPRPAELADRTHVRSAAGVEEPPTGRALWPTFMRRTLDEEDLRRRLPALRPAAKPR